MIDIFKIKENFIIKNSDFNMQLISMDIIESYIDILRSDFYNEYLDFKFDKDINKEKLINLMRDKAIQYDKNDCSTNEYRFVILNSLNHIIAGYTLYKDEEELEIAYFVVPEYQGKGIAKRLIHEIFKILLEVGCKDMVVKVNIQSKNLKSLNMAKELGFKHYKRYKGRFCRNIELKRVVGD